MIKATDTITVVEGYDAMRVFLETVWRRHDKPVEEIAFLLGSLKWADGSPVDPTMWHDWLAGGVQAQRGFPAHAQRWPPSEPPRRAVGVARRGQLARALRCVEQL